MPPKTESEDGVCEIFVNSWNYGKVLQSIMIDNED